MRMPLQRCLILVLLWLMAGPSMDAGISAATSNVPASLEMPENASRQPDHDSWAAALWRPHSYSTDPCPTDFEAQVVVLINEERIGHGLPPLLIDARLQNAARRHSGDMALTDVFSHVGSDGAHSWDRASQEGYDWTTFGENIAAGQSTPEQVVGDWMASTSGHRELILDSTKEHIGVGFVYLDDGVSGDWDHYWTADIGATDQARLAPPLACDPSALRVFLPFITTP